MSDEKTAIEELTERAESVVALTLDRKAILELNERLTKLEKNQNEE